MQSAASTWLLIGPIWVRNFAVEEDILAGRTADQWQQDAFGQVDGWLRALGLREYLWRAVDEEGEVLDMVLNTGGTPGQRPSSFSF